MILDLCSELLIGAKGPSASIDDAQADRVRRRANKDGLIKPPEPPAPPVVPVETSPVDADAAPVVPVVPVETAVPAVSSATVSAEAVPAASTAPTEVGPPGAEPLAPAASSAPQQQQAEPEPLVAATASKTSSTAVQKQDLKVAAAATTTTTAPPGAAATGTKTTAPPDLASQSSNARTSEAKTSEAKTSEAKTSEARTSEAKTSEARTSEATTGRVAKAARTERRATIASSGSVAPAKRSAREVAQPSHESSASARSVAKRPPASAPPSRPAKQMSPPVSRSGKPIPPPPPPRRFRPVPTQGASQGVAARPDRTGTDRRPPRSSGPARPGSAGRGPGADRGTGAPRRSPSSGGPRPLGGPRPAVPGAGARPGSRGVPGGAQRRPPRRKSRRRRVREELQPIDMPTYTPRHAEVPEGVVVIERASSAQDFGPKLNRTAADVVRFLMQQGEMVTATQSLSDDMMDLFAAEIGAEIRLVDPGEEQEEELQKLLRVDDDRDSSEAGSLRPPVITVMGHVDHGKTLLLDRIRNTSVVDGEAGGITQHIGAYRVEHNGRLVTFIDTPGHEAFTAMRARGAEATDIVILVVAADDGVMPQTIEAISHARAADVPIVVAVNKIDRPNADLQRTVAGVAEQGLVPEAWGGDTIYCEVSALQNQGIEELLDQVLLVSELEDLRASSEGRANGVVLESNLDIGRGPVATVLVRHGTLGVGDPMVAGAAWGRVRALLDDRGHNVTEAGPSTPVQVLGLSDVAVAGDAFTVAPNDKIAGRVADKREHWQRLSSLGRDAHALAGGAKLEELFTQIQRGESATLNLIVKADVNGSLEAVIGSLRKIETSEVRIAVLHRGVGGITENDIQLAAASNATIIGFNVRLDRKARESADTENVEIRTYEIIYKLLEDVSSAMVGMLAPEIEEIITGEAEVRQVFRVPRVGSVAGCYVLNGTITRGSKVRFLREGTIIWKGEISSLKRFKEDAREVNSGYECGIGLSAFQDLKSGDIIETYTEREIAPTLDS